MHTAETEASHLREMVLRASSEMSAAGFLGDFPEQLARVLEAVRARESELQELAKLRQRLAEVDGAA